MKDKIIFWLTLVDLNLLHRYLWKSVPTIIIKEDASGFYLPYQEYDEKTLSFGPAVESTWLSP